MNKQTMRSQGLRMDKPQQGKDWVIPEANIALIWINPGSFLMGSPKKEKGRQKGKSEAQHKVNLTKGFWLGKYPVTQQQWKLIMGNNPSRYKGSDKPVENVSWKYSMDFCQKLTDQEVNAGRLNDGQLYSLPTEAQWEYSCRSGTETPFHYGSSLDSTRANFNGRRPYGGAPKGIYRKETVAVGTFPPNKWGLYDMHGNVLEWCLDWNDDKPYLKNDSSDPIGSSSGIFRGRIIRGGSWNGDGGWCRSASRDAMLPSMHANYIGFRLLLTT